MDLNPIIDAYISNGIYYSGWSLVVVYEDNTLPNNQLNIYDGLEIVNYSFNNSVSFNINNLNIVNSNNASMTYLAWNGSPSIFFNESILINNNILNNSLNPAKNPFNCTNSFTGSSSSWNMDIDTFDISPYINIGDTSANITMNSLFTRIIQCMITSIRSELPDASVQINTVTGQEICGNRNLAINYTVANTNSNAVLPTNVPVSFYANNTLLQTIFTTAPIAIGASLSLSQNVTIPLSIPNNFVLKIKVNDNGTGASTVAESNLNNNESVQNITLSSVTVTPTFSIQNTFCQGANVPKLPQNSINNISGTWLPNVIDNQVNGTYIFTPNAGQCANSFTLNVTVNQLVTPNFSISNNFCQGANIPVLSTNSNNNISGTWSPNIINNQINGSYIFTPNAGQCASSFTLNITIIPNSIQVKKEYLCLDVSNNPIQNLVLTTGLNAQNFQFQWFKDTIFLTNNSNSLAITSTGNYQAIATNILTNCQQLINFEVVALALPKIEITTTEDFLDNHQITVLVDGNLENYTFQLNNNLPQNTNVFPINQGGDYNITISDTRGCHIIKKNVTIWQYPKFFTPNGDGFNDYWGIKTQQNINVIIFDRYGNLIKNLKRNKSWDGLLQGKPMPASDYWFVIEYQKNNENKIFKGHFGLKR